MFTLATSSISPSRWMSRGLLSVARRDLSGALLPLAEPGATPPFFLRDRGLHGEVALPARLQPPGRMGQRLASRFTGGSNGSTASWIYW